MCKCTVVNESWQAVYHNGRIDIPASMSPLFSTFITFYDYKYIWLWLKYMTMTKNIYLSLYLVYISYCVDCIDDWQTASGVQTKSFTNRTFYFIFMQGL